MVIGRARLLVPTDGGTNEIPLHGVKRLFQPPEYVTGLLTFRKQFYYDVALLFHRALSKNKVVARSKTYQKYFTVF